MAKTNKGRKLFATTATAALVASAIVPVASAAEVNDINSVASYAKDAVQDLVDRGVIEGDAKGNFNPRNSVTRAEAATIFAKALDLESTGSINFSDVKSGAWYYDAIAAAVNNGVFQGQGAGKFNPSGNLTRSEAAVIYVNAFGLEGSDDLSSFKDASAVKAWAKEAIQIAVANGVLKGDDKGNLNPNANITKQDFAVMFARAEAVVDPATNLKDALEDLKTASEKLVETVTAENVAAAKTAVADTKEAITAVEEALKAAQEAEVVTEEEVKAIEEAITAAKAALEKAEKAVAGYEESLTVAKVESVSATNLKQVVVKFNVAVDEVTAGDADYYTIVDGSDNEKEIKAATISEDKKSVILTLADGVEFDNQEEYELNFDNVKAGGKVVSVKDYAFTPVDSSLPVVETVTALGNKTVKIQFSEPIKVANTSHFLIDGNTVVGSTNVVGNTVILRTYSALSNGDHKIEIKNVEDFAEFKSLAKEFTFNVVEDVTAPTIGSVVNATFEKVTLKFSEAIDPSTVNPTSFYWLDGTSKKYANKVTPVSDDTFVIEFSSENKLVYATNLYVTGARDYSSNAIVADSKIQVTPVIDQTRPEVVSASLSDGLNVITVKFNKVLNETSAETAKNYVIKDADGKEVSKLKEATLGADGKTVTVTLVQALSQGKTYTLEVSGVSDNTTLKNVILPYSKTLTIGDKTGPAVADVSVTRNYNTTTGANSIYVSFPEVMAVTGDGSIVEKAKYMYFDGTTWKPLPTAARINVTSDGKSAVITFPSNVGVNTVAQVRVQLVKDAAGNYMQPLTNDFTVGNAANAQLLNVKATATNKLVLTFDQYILANTVSPSDFTVTANGNKLSVLTAEATDDEEVTLTLADNSKLNPDGKFGVHDVVVDVKDSNVATVTPAGKPIVDAATPAAATAVDKIKASLKGIVGGSTIAVKFDELLDASSDTGAENDFIIKTQAGAVLPTSAYTVNVVESTPGVGTDTVTISFNSPQSGVYTVELANARYLEDAADNKVAAFEATQVQVSAANPTALAGVSLSDATGAANDGKSVITLPSAGTGNSFVYKISGDTNPVTAPFVGTVPTGYTAVTNGAPITVANGKNVGVAEVDSNGKVVKFVNVVAANANFVAATAATLTSTVNFVDDTAVATATAGGKTLTVTVDGSTAQTVTIPATVVTKTDLLALFTALTGVTASWDANTLKLVSTTTGSSSSITVGGTDANFFGTALSVTGTPAAN